MTQNIQVIIRELPTDKLAVEHFEVQEAPMPEPAQGEVLVRGILLSQDAANRSWMQGATYRAAIEPGTIMSGHSIGEVIESRSPAFQNGDIVWGDIGWQRYGAVPADALVKQRTDRPLSHLISVLGIAGKTAYHGLLNVPGIHAGETLLVSAAAGSVGNYVGQIGKIKGARVVGIAGGKDKCQWLQDEFGFDACVDYKDETRPLIKALQTACPQGVDVYFDNTGGDILQAALMVMNGAGRISCCGAISGYDGQRKPGPSALPGMLIVKSLKMEGFLVSNFAALDADAEHELGRWIDNGDLKVVEDIIEGIENAPRGLVGLLAGDNRGKRMIRLGPDPA